MATAPQPLFVDQDGEPLRFFLPMSLASRSAFKDKIELHGGVLVQSELMPNIIKIGDPARPQSYDASWLNFRYIDDALRESALQNPSFYVMENPTIVPAIPMQETWLRDPMPTTQRATPISGGLLNGVGTRGTRTEFTPEEDDILRRIVHRPGVATSGNKIYQLIAQQYGGHSFHSWRDRYIRHMRPIWGPPTDEAAMDVNATDDYILTQSYLRAPHMPANERASRAGSLSIGNEGSDAPEERALSPPPQQQQQQQLRTPATPPIIKKQRAAFSTTDDEILLRAISEKGETASTFKTLGHRHPHHTWESWKNRVKALKKKNRGSLPDPDQTLALDLSDLSAANMELDLSLPAQSSHVKKLQVQSETEIQRDLVDPNIDPNLQQLQHLSMILDDPNQQVFEQQFSEQAQYDPTQDLVMQEQLHEEDQAGSPFDFHQTTEEILRQNLQGHVSDLQIPHQSPIKKRAAPRIDSATDVIGKRQINIHDPTADENAGPVSDIEDGLPASVGPAKRAKRQPAKKRKTNAAALAAAERAAIVARSGPQPSTPSKLLDDLSSSNPKSARLEHHERERPGLVQAIRDDAMPDFVVEISQPKMTRATRARATGTESQPLQAIAMSGRGRQWAAIQNNAKPTETFIRSDADLSDDALRAEEQIRGALRAHNQQATKTGQDALNQIVEDSFLQPDNVRPSDLHNQPLRSNRKRLQQEVRATPESSPNFPPVSVLLDGHKDNEFDFDAPSPTPASPNTKSYSQSQFLPDTQAIRGDLVDFDFDTTIPELEPDSEQQRRQSEILVINEQRKSNWIERQTRVHNIPAADALDAWNRTSGNQSIAVKVINAYERGESPPRIPGVWTDSDDEIIKSADTRAMQEVARFHLAVGSVEGRVDFLNQQQGIMG